MPGYKIDTCVWETTLRCNLNCRHCGSKAGQAREAELSTKEAYQMFEQLAELGCQRVIMSGGEPLLRPDIQQLAEGIQSCGMKACLITNGIAVPRNIKLLEKMSLYSIGLSLDGMATTHNFLRANPLSFAKIVKSLELLKSYWSDVYVITQVNKYNFADLANIYDLLLTYEPEGWQIQLTNDMGRAEDLKDLMLSKAQIKQLLDFIIARKNGPVPIFSADDLGYYYQDYFCFKGCQGGLSALGIEADGTVKPCLSMQKDRCFDGGNLRQRKLKTIWHDPNFAVINRQKRQLKGQCAVCEHANECRGGCVATAMAFDSLEEFPFCVKDK